MKKITELTGHMNRVLYMGMSPDGSTIVSGAADETLRFWMINDIDKINETQGDTVTARIVLGNNPGMSTFAVKLAYNRDALTYTGATWASSVSLNANNVQLISEVRRSSVIVSFLFGAAFFHEKNLKGKAVDLALVIISMIFLYIGSR